MAENDLSYLQAQIKKLTDENKFIQEQLDKKNLDEEESLKKQIQLHENLVSIAERKLELATRDQRSSEAYLKELRETRDEAAKGLKDVLDGYNKQKQLMDEVNHLSRDFAGEINGLMGVMNNLNDSGFGRMLTLINKSGSTINAINNAALKLSENLKTRITLSLAEKGQEMFLGFFEQMDEAGANLAKAIPQGRQYQKMVEGITTGNQAAFFSFEQVGESVIALNTNFSEFSRLSDPEKNKLIKLSATLDKIGVSTETLAENLDVATKALGLSTDEFADFQGQLFNLSKQLGVNMDTLNKRFKDVSGKLAVFEKTKAIKIFKEMNVVSKNLGIEFNKLFDITENFTTFEGAAEAAGSLNSVLGGNLINTIDLMNAALDNPIEVFKQFKGAIDKTGKSFDSMTPAMKRMIAETMKMDVSEVDRLMRMDMTQGIKEMSDMAASTEEMQKAARDATPVIDKLIKLGYKFAVLISPAVDAVNYLVDGLMKFVSEHPKVAKSIGGIVMGLGLLVAGLLAAGKAIVFIKAIAMSFGGGGGGIVGAILGKGVGGMSPTIVMTKFGTAATSSAKGILSLGAAALMVGAGIGAAAYGMSLFVLAFKDMSPEQIQGVTIAIGIFTGGLVLMTLALSLVAKTAGRAGIELLPLGAAIGLIGAGIGVAAWGMSKLVESFTEFMKVADLGKLVNVYLGVNALAAAFYALASSFVAVGLAAPGLYAALPALMAYNAFGLNQQVSNSANKASAAGGGDVIVQIPGETITLQITAPIMMDKDKVGEFVQEQIVKREDKMVGGRIQSAVGIKTGGYQD